jgi:IS5 family transposase
MWPNYGSLLILGVNDTWSDFQRFSRGKSVSAYDWKSAREILYAEDEKFVSQGGVPVKKNVETCRFVVRKAGICLRENVYRKGASLSHKQILEIFSRRMSAKGPNWVQLLHASMA